jgi:WD40 repeat protein
MTDTNEIETLRQILCDESRSGFWRRRRAVQRLARLAREDGHASSLSPTEARIVVEGLAVGLEGVHWGVATHCRRTLAQLTAPFLIEAVCDLLLEQDLPHLRTLAVHHRYVPQDPVRRAAYLFVLGRLQDYATHDPDGAMVEHYYLRASPALRERLLGIAQGRGDPCWQKWLLRLGSCQGWADLTEAEHAAVIDVLCQGQRWEAIWAFVLAARVPWSWRGARALAETSWCPPEEQAGHCWRELMAAVQTVSDPTAVGTLVGWQQAMLQWHQDWVGTLAVSPDGQWLASGSDDRTIRLWKLPWGNEGVVLRRHQGTVWALAVSPDGQWLASGSGDRTVRLWELPGGAERAVLYGHQNWVEALAVGPDGQWLASSGEDRTIRLWRLPRGKEWVVLRGHQGAVQALAVSPDGQWLISGGEDRTIRLWRLPRGKEWVVLCGHQGAVRALAVSPDGQLLASGSEDGTIRLWELPGGAERVVLRGHQGAVRALVMSPTGQWLASGGEDGTLRLWGLPGGAEHAVLHRHKGKVVALTVSPTGQWLASSGEDKIICLWELQDMSQMLHAPLGHMGQTEYERMQRCAAEASLSPEQRAVAHYIAAVLRYRLGEGTP